MVNRRKRFIKKIDFDNGIKYEFVFLSYRLEQKKVILEEFTTYDLFGFSVRFEIFNKNVRFNKCYW